MVSVDEHNCTWQMATRVCFNTAKIVNHVQGIFGNKLFMQFLSVRGMAKDRYIVILNAQSESIHF